VEGIEMTMFRITSRVSGQRLGEYEAADEQGALDVMARDAGYMDHADACAQSGDDGAHLLVEEVVAGLTYAESDEQRAAAFAAQWDLDHPEAPT
jgi:hypothetical protein